MNAHLQELSNISKGRTIFILGGGPSITDIDISKVISHPTIAINNSYKLSNSITALYWGDSSWISKHAKDVESHPCKLRFTSRFHTCIGKSIIGEAGATILKRSKEYGYDANIHNVSGNNSGCHALNLAINLNPKNIVLLGYDMRIVNRKTHWHEGHGYGLRPDIYSELFIPSIESLAKEFNATNKNIKIFNGTKNSAIKCFDYIDYKEFI